MRVSQLLVQRDAGRQADEQHDAHVVVAVLADARGLGDLRHLLDLGVDLGGADAHAAGVQRGVRAAMDDHAAMLGPFGEVAMAPDVVEALEIGRVVLLALRVVPEETGMDGKGFVQTSSPFSAGSADPGRPRRRRPCPGRPPGFRRPHRLGRHAEHEAGDDVGAARDRGEVHVALDAFIDVAKSLRRQRRAGGGDGADGGQVVAVDRPEPRSCAARRCTSPRCRNSVIFSACGVVEQDVAVGVEGRAVVEQQGGASPARPDTSQFHIIQPQVVK